MPPTLPARSSGHSCFYGSPDHPGVDLFPIWAIPHSGGCRRLAHRRAAAGGRWLLLSMGDNSRMQAARRRR